MKEMIQIAGKFFLINLEQCSIITDDCYVVYCWSSDGEREMKKSPVHNSWNKAAAFQIFSIIPFPFQIIARKQLTFWYN